MRDSLPNVSYRSLERFCREQAALASTKETRVALEAMATEYRARAERVEKEQSTPD
jgi:hypothetical protein